MNKVIAETMFKCKESVRESIALLEAFAAMVPKDKADEAQNVSIIWDLGNAISGSESPALTMNMVDKAIVAEQILTEECDSFEGCTAWGVTQEPHFNDALNEILRKHSVSDVRDLMLYHATK